MPFVDLHNVFIYSRVHAVGACDVTRATGFKGAECRIFFFIYFRYAIDELPKQNKSKKWCSRNRRAVSAAKGSPGDRISYRNTRREVETKGEKTRVYTSIYLELGTKGLECFNSTRKKAQHTYYACTITTCVRSFFCVNRC